MKIGIIGGGVSGLVTAWLLDKHHEIILFEKQNRLGGHVRTENLNVENKVIPIEAGFEFFNDDIFPYLCRLLKLLNIEVQKFPLTYIFYDANRKVIFEFPIIQNKKIKWKNFLPSSLFKLIQFKYLLNKAQKFLAKPNKLITLKNFLDNLFFLTKSFKDNFFYPFFSAGWGVSVDQFKSFSAWDILTWIVKNQPSPLKPKYWNEIVNGASTYIQAIVDKLSTTKIKLNANITNITNSNNAYIITEADGTQTQVDHIIFASNAYNAHNLLKNVYDVNEISKALSKIKFVKATIAIHGDKNFMPKDKVSWSVANVCFDGNYNNLTIYKSWRSPIPIFRSWINPNVPRTNNPEPLYTLDHFYHAIVDKDYFKTQKIITKFQGIKNIWFAGLYTNGIDSHESAIVSAINIAKKLAPKSLQLKDLLKIK